MQIFPSHIQISENVFQLYEKYTGLFRPLQDIHAYEYIAPLEIHPSI